MADENYRRKLTAILSADAVGYSRLMQKDEAWTIQAVENSKRIIGALVNQFNGRVVDATGDQGFARSTSADFETALFRKTWCQGNNPVDRTTRRYSEI